MASQIKQNAWILSVQAFFNENKLPLPSGYHV